MLITNCSLLHGRQGRLLYGFQLLLFLLPLVAIHPLLDTAGWWAIGLATLLIVVGTASMALLAIRRLHDLNLSGWYALLLILPVLNLPGLLALVLLPGAAAANQWGPVPRLTLPAFRLAELRFAVSLFIRISWWRMLLH